MSASTSGFDWRRLDWVVFALGLLIVPAGTIAASARVTAEQSLADAQLSLIRGDLENAAERLLAAQRLAQGDAHLEVAVAAVEALLHDARGAGGMQIRYRAVLIEARAAGAIGVEAATQLNYANHMAQRVGVRAEVRQRFGAAAALARHAGRADIELRAWLGLAQALGSDDREGASQALARALAVVSGEMKPERLARDLVAAGEIAATAGVSANGQDALRLYATAADAAERAGDLDLAAKIVGLEGEAHAALDRHERALELFGKALLASRGRAELEYRWLWGMARSRKALGDHEGALKAYATATRRLSLVRGSLPVLDAYGGSFFRRRVEPLYRERATLLVEAGQLAAARSSIEDLKAAELENYFRDDCVERLRAARRGVGALENATAVLYPLVMDDRLELVLEFQNGLLRASSSVSRKELAAVADRFAAGLAGKGDVTVAARRLYAWLIAPVIEELQKAAVKTLVFVPDGSLRKVTLAALPAPPGKGMFLVESFALVQTPGLTLAAGGDGREGRILAAGLTTPPADEDLAPLPHVRRELRTLRDRFGADILPGEAFSRDGLEERLAARSYSIVHVATHAEFAGSVEDSRLIAPGGDIGLDDLETMMLLTSFRTQPVDLLTLSACQTARGDDRALLGLAGIAVKSGARSALATLWLVEDEAAADLSAGFYEAFLEDGLDKAQALRRAQLKMMRLPGREHPYYWAAFILIGNWS